MSSSLAPLLQHHAFIDLETTGLDPRSDQVIEVGVVFVERGQLVRRVGQLLRPASPLPVIIKRLTGLDDKLLESQPSFGEYRAELKALLLGWTVVAHNAAFERAFMDGLLEELHAPVLDSCELYHYLYPELASHSLEAMVKWAGLGNGAQHRALEDAEDTFHALSFALQRCIEEARQDDLRELLEMLGHSASGENPGQLSFDHTPSPMRALLEGLHGILKKRPARLQLEEDSAFLPAREERRRKGAAARNGELSVSSGEVDAVLGPNGALEALGAFEPRHGQLQLARAVASALSDGGTLAVEAATGIGKSLGYLAPAALFAAKTGAKVGIAPHTKTLQDQLVEKELPRLHRALGGAFSYSVLKGQANYACRRRALEATRVTAEMSLDERAPRAYFRAFLRRSPDGDLDRVSHWFKDRYPVLDELIAASRSHAAATLAERCPHYARCFYHSAVAQAKDADLVVVNQALALRWPARYPAIDHLIIDEAHELEDTATSAWSEEITDAALGALVERLAGRRGLATTLRRGLSEELGADLTQATSGLAADTRTLTDALRSLAPADAPPGAWERRIDQELRTTRGWVRVRDALHRVRDTLDGIERVLAGRVAEVAPALEHDDPGLEREISAALEAVRELKPLVEHLADRPDDGRCHEVALREPGWSLAARPIDIAPRFHSELVTPKRTLVLASATLSTGPDSPFVLERLGLARGGHQTPVVRISGSFDLMSQALVVLVTDAPDPSSEAFVDWAALRIGGLAAFLCGRVLGLFASTRRLDAVDQKVRETLEPIGIEVMRQSKGSARLMAARQEQDAGTVLMGTKTFWHGVDIPGPGVACVFIDKLPLEPQGRPIVEAREEKLGADSPGTEGVRGATSDFRARGFMRYRLPRALLQLRQGVGRLVRTPTDRGVVVIADPGNAAYRAQLYEALEGYRVEALPWAQARVRISHFLKRMGLGGAQPIRRPDGPGQGLLFPTER
ncbi:MAG: exonuclease [Archangiaceae bacterium]|nr:exonuclease [Archangiaceae bacterium]